MKFAGCRRIVLLLFVPFAAQGQITTQGASIAPTNDLPNPYRTIEGWAQLGRAWGSTSAVDIDPDGRSVWVAERCGPNSCLGSDLPAVPRRMLRVSPHDLL